MFEFLNELKNKTFYNYATDCEKSMKLHNNANSFASFFEVSFKILYGEITKDYSSTSSRKNLYALLGEKQFVQILREKYNFSA